MLRLRQHMSLYKKYLQFSFITLLLLLSGCSDYDSSSSASFGFLSLKVREDVQVKSPEGGVIEGVKPLPPSDVTVTMEDEEGKYAHTWESLMEFPEREQYFIGTYMLTAAYGTPLDEGFDSPYYFGSTQARVSNHAYTEAVIDLGLVSCLTTVTYKPIEHPDVASVSGVLNTGAGGYFQYPMSESRLLYVQPGSLRLYLEVTMTDGRSVSFLAGEVEETVSSTMYDFSVAVDETTDGTPVITTAILGKKEMIAISDEFLAMAPPVIETKGWSDGEVMTLPEGDMPSAEISARVTSAAAMKHLFFSVNSASLRTAGMPVQVDLLNLSEDEAALLARLGLQFSLLDDGVDVNLTSLLSNLVYFTADDDMSVFLLMAEDVNGKVSEPATLNVRTTPVEIEIADVHTSVVGINKGVIEVRSTAPGFVNHVEIEIETVSGSDEWTKTEVSDITAAPGSIYLVTFPIPEGSEPVNVRVLYCEEVRANVTIARVMPEFTIDVDAFANFGVVKIVTDDEVMRGIITDHVVVYANDEKASVLSRYPESGLLTILGLTPSTTYHFKATMMTNPAEGDFTNTMTVRTEGTPQFSNGDFEERNDGVSYKDLPSGGRYSQTTVEIFNWQNHTSYSQLVPKGWANTNAKTFCKAASNYNTWYMQPSVFTVNDVQSGDFAVSLRSVAFDPDGEPIPDYAQTGDPYLPYSLNVPRIAYRAAGKLFLGDYHYDAATGKETYNEGVAWNSRPVSLNGFYKYKPSENNWNDRGLVTVEVLGEREGKEIVIASAHRILPLATGYTAFSVPLDYAYYGVKATRIKVMFASSDKIGTIEEETAAISTLADPRTATSLGSQLWVDNVTLAY